jgi:transposase InsO family protein
LKDFDLHVKFNDGAQPTFVKPRTVPYAVEEELNLAYDAGISRGVWKPTQFNDYGTPVVPVRKSLAAGGSPQRKLRVCGDYSVTVNSQLADHHQPIPLPEDLMRKLSGGYAFTKIDLADAYNQIRLDEESQKRLALSTHRGVLLQLRLPFGIKSAPSYFQEIMERLTADLSGVAVYLDDILVSGSTAEEHLTNLRGLLQRLNDKGLRCRLETCKFAQPSVEYLGHLLSHRGIAKGPKADALLQMPPPTDVSGLKSFLGSLQFYHKFLPNLATVTEPLHELTRNEVEWRWGALQQNAFTTLKGLLCNDTVLAHFDPSLPIGISCDASNCGLGVVLFHRYSDGSERPIANASKTLTETQRKYSQIHKEALSIIFGLRKFHQFLYGRRFILVTDHQPLTSLFGADKGTPSMAANRLARWSLILHQYDYEIEYRRTDKHGNADALSRLPAGEDPVFDQEEEEEDIDTVCAIKTIAQQLKLSDIGLQKATEKDPVLSQVMRFTREGWPPKDTSAEARSQDDVNAFRKIADSLTISNGCLLYGLRVVIPTTLQPQVLNLLHLGHFGIERMKQLARTAVYWPCIDADITGIARQCTACNEHQNAPTKLPIHPWMVPEKPWSRVHIDHAIDFMGSNWLVMIDAYSKYPCIHATTSTSTKSTTALLEEDFAHFGYPHTIVTDNATSFTSEEFKQWCAERGIIHLTGAPYHPATNGAAERLVQSFKQSLRKPSLPPKAALQEFLMLYRRTPLSVGYSPSELLNKRQLRCKIDVLLPVPAHLFQAKQSALTSQPVAKIEYAVGTPCYALYCGPRRTQDPRWIAAVVTRVFGPRTVNVRVTPTGPTWKRHLDQLRPRHASPEDTDPGDATTVPTSASAAPPLNADPVTPPRRRNPRLPTGSCYGRHNPRRSERIRAKDRQ